MASPMYDDLRSQNLALGDAAVARAMIADFEEDEQQKYACMRECELEAETCWQKMPATRKGDADTSDDDGIESDDGDTHDAPGVAAPFFPVQSTKDRQQLVVTLNIMFWEVVSCDLTTVLSHPVT